uniref:Uncharacterized protein n=1 Tax=Arundo donax TaxID=35708 RepID=A0A0A9G973_ARUDO
MGFSLLNCWSFTSGPQSSWILCPQKKSSWILFVLIVREIITSSSHGFRILT